MEQYSEDWEKEMMLLPKETIVRIAAHLGRSDREEIKKLKEIVSTITVALIGGTKFVDKNQEILYLKYINEVLNNV